MAADADAKGRLLQAATELFARDGYAGVTVRTIADRAGTNAAAVSYHFGGKGPLYAAAVRLACRELAAVPRGSPAVACWAKLLGHELLRGGPLSAEIASAVCSAAPRFEPVGEPAAPLLAVAGLMALAVAARPECTREEVAAAWAVLDHARGPSRSPFTPAATLISNPP